MSNKILNTYHSNDSPLQAPKMTTDQVHAILSPKGGMIVFNTDTSQLLIYAAGAWIAIGNVGRGGVASIDTGNGLTGGPITRSGIIGLADTGVTEGNYTYPSISVDAQGRITTADTTIIQNVTIGKAILSGTIGTTINTNAVTNNSIIHVTRNCGYSTPPLITTIGNIIVGSIIDNESFTIYSTIKNDFGGVNWYIISG